MRLRIGLNPWAQFTGWEEVVGIARVAEALGFEGLWSSDHLLPYVPSLGDAHGEERVVAGPIFEGWTLLAAWAHETERIRLGCAVSAAAFRSPPLMVRMATTLDHLSGGRMTLGLGAGWFAAEHERNGFELLPPAERFDRFAEATAICRGLLDGGPVTVAGRWWSVRDAVNDPPPVQARLPLLLGGSGEQRTIPLVARYADAWNCGASLAELPRKKAALEAACRAIGRDPRSIRTVAQVAPAIVRATREEAVAVLAESYGRNGVPWNEALELANRSPNVGTVEDVVAGLAAVARAGFEEATLELPLPADMATLEAIAGPVRTRLAGLLA